MVCGRTQSHIDQTASRISSAGGHAEAIAADVSDWKSLSALAQKMQQSHGKLDILVNNAGIGGFGGPLHQMPLENWDAVMNTNLRGVFYAIRAFVPLLVSAGGGHIINISSIPGKNALPNGAAYAASKWGLNGLSYSVAEELRGQKIRVSVICPAPLIPNSHPMKARARTRCCNPMTLLMWWKCWSHRLRSRLPARL